MLPISLAWIPVKEAGIYPIHVIILSDDFGNSVTYTTQDLQNLGFTAEFEVISPDEDIEPPVLVDFTLNSTVVDVTNGPATLFGSLTATDDLSGVQSVTVNGHTPSGKNFWAVVSGPISGDTNNGVWAIRFDLVPGDEAGIYPIHQIAVRDDFGNTSYYRTQDLQNLGFTAEFEVIYSGSPAP